MRDGAAILAGIRAGGPQQLDPSERAAAERAAALAGRRLVEVSDARGHRAFTVGYRDGHEPSPKSDGIDAPQLTALPLVTLAVCLGLCWPDRDERVYPGAPSTVDEVLDVLASMGAQRRNVLGAMRGELALARLVEVRAGEVRLGPAVAAWTDSQVDALRRFADILPGAVG